jgi:uncharacterized protein involved in cysteine biosynthesis
LVVAAIVWLGMAIAAWHPVSAGLGDLFGMRPDDASTLSRIAAQIVAVLIFAALAAVTALTAIAVLAMPVIVRTVAARHFPALAAQRGGSFAGSARNALFALLLFMPLWLASLALLIFPPAYAVASLALNAWLSQRMFCYDALAEHATGDELASIIRERKARLLLLGLVLSPLSLVPVVNVLVLPVYAGIAFTELCLSELAHRRARAEPARG